MVSARTAFHTIAARLAVPRAASGTLLISLGIPSVTPISFVVRRIAASVAQALHLSRLEAVGAGREGALLIMVTERDPPNGQET